VLRAVSLDFGQTLASLDPRFLADRLRGRGVDADEAKIEAAVPAAWARYDELVRQGVSGHPWRELMRVLLEGAGVPERFREELVEWLWREQPRKNLWRKPISGMFRLCLDLEKGGVPFGVLSNSEGRLAELVDEMGWADVIRVVVDSGRVGIEKPDRRIFEILAERLGTDPAEVVHVGDSLAADVMGALGAGMCAVWFTRATELPEGVDPARVKIAHDAPGVRRALEELGLTIPELERASAWP
jgi:FMN phosphatase YigB (HAD superfamily)